jgi:hypothetical protein
MKWFAAPACTFLRCTPERRALHRNAFAYSKMPLDHHGFHLPGLLNGLGRNLVKESLVYFMIYGV